MRSSSRIFAVILAVSILATSVFAAGGFSAADTDSNSVGEPKHLVWMILYATIALGFSFLCSVAEAVVLSIGPSFLANLEQEGHKAAPLLSNIKRNIDRTLTAILTLNTIAHTVGAGGAGAEAAAYFGAGYVGIAMAILTFLILFLSEIIPKTIGAVYWRQLAKPTAHFVRVLTWVLYPLLVVSESLTKLLTKGKSVHAISREEFSELADVGVEHGNIDPKESRILKNLLRFPALRIEDIMTPRTVVFACQEDATVHDTLKENPDIHFSRIPVYGEDRDDISGLVLKTDLLINESRNDGKGKLRDLKRDLGRIRSDTSLSSVLDHMLNDRQHILLAVDEYGGTQGIVTLEDVVETLIGIEIVDEADKDVDMRAVARKKWEERVSKMGIDVKESSAEE